MDDTRIATPLPEYAAVNRAKGQRPVFLNPLKVRLPVTAMVSIAHRVSGALLTLLLPLAVYGLHVSLQDTAEPSQWAAALRSVPGRIGLLVLVWAVAHHTAAGVRHLLFDMGRGTRYAQARRTAWAVHAVAAACVVLALLGMAIGAWS